MPARPPSDDALGARLGWLVFLSALALRLVALAQVSGSVWNEVLLSDARFFDEWGLRIASGDVLGHEVFYNAPLYPYLLGGLYAVFGHHLVVVRGLQCLAGAVAATWIGAGTARLFGRRSGLAAGLLAATYVPAIAYDLRIEKASCAFFLGAFLVWLVARYPASRTSAAWAGLALGALVLLRENAVVLLLPLGVRYGRRRAGRGARLLALVGGAALLLAPVAARNAWLGGGFVPTATNVGVNFFLGSGPGADGMYRPVLEGRGHPDHEREDARALAEELSGRSLSPGQVSGFWFRLTLRGIAREPAAFVGLLGDKLRLLTHRQEIMDGLAIETQVDSSRLLRLLFPWCGFGLLLPLCAAGLLRARGRAGSSWLPGTAGSSWLPGTAGSSWLPGTAGSSWLLAAAGCLALGLLAFFVTARFRLGIVPFLLPFAGLAVAEVRTWIRAPAALATALLTALLAWWPLELPGDPRSTSASNLASELLRLGRAQEAEGWARRAVELDPSSADAAYNLGLCLRRLGRDQQAIGPFENARRLEPAYEADALAELGAIRAMGGERELARVLLLRALALEPEHEAAQRYLRALDAQDGPAERVETPEPTRSE